MPSEILLEFKKIGKRFGPNRVLSDVSFDLRAGEVHVLAGENGAGKSTLIKILAGIHTDYEGSLEVAGQEVRFANPQEANRSGISVIHQEMSLIDTMSVADNIRLGREATRAGQWWLHRRTQLSDAHRLCRQLDLEFSESDLGQAVERFPLSVKTRIEIAKALAFDARIFVMDEPTGALNRAEVEKLFVLVETLKDKGCGIIYISHRMEEIYRIADRITVLRDGRRIGTASSADCPEPQLIRWMVGRDLASRRQTVPSPASPAPAEPLLMIQGFEVPDPRPGRPPAVSQFSSEVRAGEIVGLAGVHGSGCTELFQGLFGIFGSVCSGKVRLDGHPFDPTSPGHSIQNGLAYLSGDRKGTGLVLGMSVQDNINLASLPRLSPWGVLRPPLERSQAARQITALDIRLASAGQPVGTLSGGNQQKVALAKWLEARPKVLLLEEPTRGVDVGAKQEIYSLMNQWTSAGMGIFLLSTDLTELLLLSDRVLALHRGKVAAEFTRAQANPDKVMAAAMGSSATASSMKARP